MPQGRNYKANLNLDVLPYEGMDTALWVEFTKVYNAIQNLARYTDLAAGVQDLKNDDTPGETVSVGRHLRIMVRAIETINAGNIVSLLKEHGGTELVAMKATFSATYPGGPGPIQHDKVPRGYAPKEILAGEVGEVRLGGIHAISGLTVGYRYWLSTVSPGLITPTAPSQHIGTTADDITYYIGYALSPTELLVSFNDQIKLNP